MLQLELQDRSVMQCRLKTNGVACLMCVSTRPSSPDIVDHCTSVKCSLQPTFDSPSCRCSRRSCCADCPSSPYPPPATQDGTEKAQKVFVTIPTEVGQTEAEEIGESGPQAKTG